MHTLAARNGTGVQPASFAERAPDAYRAMLGLAGALWLEPGLRELVAIRTAQVNGCAEAVARHARQAVLLGERHDRLVALAAWRASALFTEREQAALALAEALALLPGERTFADACGQAADHFEEHELAQLVFGCVSANAWNRLELAADRV